MQMSMFDGGKRFKIDKPIRLVELFAGIGAQAKALERLGIPFEHYRICEFDKYAVKSYNAIHGTNFATSDVTKITADDLGIVDTDKYCYILTYSFPCTDLSLAGKRQGMARDSGTRSGLLWEVERLLKELEELPQVLVMENVPEVIGAKNIKHFAEWIAFLDTLGYKSKWQVLNATDFNVPQNRRRCFMVSILGDYYYEFPKPIGCKLKLKDILESNVDDKYYLSNIQLKRMANWNTYRDPLKNIDKEKTVAYTITALAYPRNSSNMTLINEAITSNNRNEFIKCNQVGQIVGKGYNDIEGRVYSIDGAIPCLTTNCGGHQEKKILVNEPTICAMRGRNPDNPNDRTKGCPTKQRIEIGDTTSNTLTTVQKDNMVVEPIKDNYRIRKLTPRECFRLMDFDDEDFDKVKAAGISDNQCYKQAGNSIVVAVLMAIFKQML